jgi:hypothetical protein
MNLEALKKKLKKKISQKNSKGDLGGLEIGGFGD